MQKEELPPAPVFPRVMICARAPSQDCFDQQEGGGLALGQWRSMCGGGRLGQSEAFGTAISSNACLVLSKGNTPKSCIR